MENIPLPAPVGAGRADELEREIQEIKKRQSKLMELYETDQIDRDILHERAETLKKRLDTTRSLLAKTRATAARQQTAHTSILQLAQLLDQLPVYLSEAPPAQVNTALRACIQCIQISETHFPKIHWKT